MEVLSFKNYFKEIYNNENFTCNNFHPIFMNIYILLLRFLRLNKFKHDVNHAIIAAN